MGDDLGSDDDFLDQTWVTKDDEPAVVSNLMDDGNDGVGSKRPRLDDDDDDSDPDAAGNDDNPYNITSNTNKTSKKKQKRLTPQNLLLDSSRGIANDNKVMQSAFLWTCYSHHLKLMGEADEINEDDKFQESNFIQPDPTKLKELGHRSLATFLKSGTISSMKKLKRWKQKGSPMVLIICLSARRGCALLKEMSGMNVRAAKLFAKHMNADQQSQILEEHSFGLGVGTPNRLLKLFEGTDEHGNTDNGNIEGALSLKHTQLIILDCHEDQKQFTVCTMNDTAPDLVKFLQVAVIPELRRRKSIKFAMY